MCRMFGFRSVLKSRVHRSLLSADNALAVQSRAHPDGWGVAYYVNGVPQVTRSTRTAVSDALFRRISGVVSSETVVAHVRQATQGALSPLNCHPFQYGRWIFAHNGDVPDFASHRTALMAHVREDLRGLVLGSTDSEVLFFMFVSALGDLDRPVALPEVAHALRVVAARAREVVGASALLTFLVTNGDLLMGHCLGKPLHYSTYKTSCLERDVCPHFAPSCEAPAGHARIAHLMVSSEPLSGENVWHTLQDGEVVGVGPEMVLYKNTVPLEAGAGV